MSQWKNDDSAANSVLWGVVGYNKTGNSANRDVFYGNTTASAYVTGITVGQFGVDPSEAASGNGTIHSVVFTSRGSGYNANATVTVAGGGGASFAANASSNSTGRISAVNITNNGVGYTSSPTLTISAPSAISFNGNTTAVTSGNSSANGYITLGANALFFAAGDQVTYLVGAGNTAIGGLTNATSYFITFANSTAVQLATGLSGPAINLTSVPTTAQVGHSVTGQTAAAAAVLSRGAAVTHAGWVVRTVGTGGRAGRVQYETLVAMGSMTGDGSDDALFKDS
jgi:hypothetical protein